MKITLSQMEKILTTSNSFSQLGFNMLLTRLSNAYKKDPTPGVLQRCTDDANGFLNKYQGIMQKDYEKIINL
jgi:hypothetical protein